MLRVDQESDVNVVDGGLTMRVVTALSPSLRR